MKFYRRTIRINGKEIKSPRFIRASDAEKWYNERLRSKQFSRDGIEIPLDSKISIGEYFTNPHEGWLAKRKRSYPKATWYSDEQRFTDYILPELGTKKIAKVSQLEIRNLLKGLVDKKGLSASTRNKVRSLLSKFFNDAMNENPPLCVDNPALNISFDGGTRLGTKKPSHMKSEQEVLKFIRCAKELGDLHFIFANIALMSALRKSEIITLRWNDFDADENELRVDERFEQASMSIRSGSKSGSQESRLVPIPDDLVGVLEKWRAKSEFSSEDDFILTLDGSVTPPRALHSMHEQVCFVAKIKVTPHGLRHTYGRMFVKNGGSLKALQTILGHSNSNTTEIYSALAGKEVKKYRNTVSFKEDEE